MIKNLLALVPHHELDADVTSCILAMCGWEARCTLTVVVTVSTVYY